MLPSDTSPEAEQVQAELLRNASTARRFQLAQSLSRMTIQLSRRALRRAHPDATEREIDLAFVELHYGHALASQVKAYLERDDP